MNNLLPNSALCPLHAHDHSLQAAAGTSHAGQRLRWHGGWNSGATRRRGHNGQAAAGSTHLPHLVEPRLGMGRCGALRHHLGTVDPALQNHAVQPLLGAHDLAKRLAARCLRSQLRESGQL